MTLLPAVVSPTGNPFSMRVFLAGAHFYRVRACLALKTSVAQRFLTSLHDLWKTGKVECVGSGNGVRWKLMERVE